MRVALASGAALLSALVLAAGARGQVPAPASELGLAGLEPGPFKLAPGDTRDAAFQVFLNATGFACPQPSTLEVGLQTELRVVKGAAVETHVDPPSLTLPVPAGAYLRADDAFRGSGPATLHILASPDSKDKVEPVVAVLASFAGGTPPGCLAPQPLPAAHAEAQQTLFITPSEVTEPPANTTGPGAPAAPSSSRLLPDAGVAGLLTACAAIALASASRRP